MFKYIYNSFNTLYIRNDDDINDIERYKIIVIENKEEVNYILDKIFNPPTPSEYKYKHIEKLILSNCNISKDNLEKLFKKIHKFKNLIELNLNGVTNMKKKENVIVMMYEYLLGKRREKILTIKLCDTGLSLKDTFIIDGERRNLYQLIRNLRKWDIEIWLNYTTEQITEIINKIKPLKYTSIYVIGIHDNQIPRDIIIYLKENYNIKLVHTYFYKYIPNDCKLVFHIRYKGNSSNSYNNKFKKDLNIVEINRKDFTLDNIIEILKEYNLIDSREGI